jgi:hypothetical protein
MVKKSAKTRKAKPAKKITTVKKAAKPGKDPSLLNELRSAAKVSASRRLNKK